MIPHYRNTSIGWVTWPENSGTEVLMLRRVLRDPGYVPSVGDDGFGTIFFHSVARLKGSPSAEVTNC